MKHHKILDTVEEPTWKSKKKKDNSMNVFQFLICAIAVAITIYIATFTG
jgi:hypothetical protein